jgi:TonB family protein
MGKKREHISSAEDYRRYLNNEMSSDERHAFEKRMLEDDFEADALEGMEMLSSGELRSDLSQIKDALDKKTKTKSGLIYWRAAAAILLLGIFSFMIYYVLNQDSRTEIAQKKESAPAEQSDVVADQQVPLTTDSIIDEIEPAIAYNKTLEDKESKIEEIVPIPEESEPISEEMETEDDNLIQGLELKGEITKEDIILQEQLNPVEPPTVAYDAIEQMMEETAPIPEATSKTSRKSSAAPTAVQEDFTLAPEMARTAAPETSYNTRTITGKVMSAEDDTSVPGVNVILKDSPVGTISDLEGNYSIEVPKDQDATLVFSFIGLESQEIEIGDEEEVNVKLEPDFSTLSEIVVVGYGESTGEENPDYSFTPPSPEGGKIAFQKYVRENIKYPQDIEEQIKGTVRLKFTVKTNGGITNMELLKSLGESFDNEAIRLVLEGPAWKPAQLNGETVERDVKVKIRFRPPE